MHEKLEKIFADFFKRRADAVFRATTVDRHKIEVFLVLRISDRGTRMNLLILLFEDLAVLENDRGSGERERDVRKVLVFGILANLQLTVLLNDKGGEVRLRLRFDETVADCQTAQIRVPGLRNGSRAKGSVEAAVDRERQLVSLEERRRRFTDGLAFVGRKIRIRLGRSDRDARFGQIDARDDNAHGRLLTDD